MERQWPALHGENFKTDWLGDDASQEAIRQANHYCGEKGKEAVFLNEDRKYAGGSTLGGVVGFRGAATDAALGKGYKTEMQFKCQ